MSGALKDAAIRVERPAKTLRELALDKVREAIVNGYFRPGDRLVERDLCAQLGVSRTVVREVLRHLESEGLVANLPNKGPIVALLDIEEAKQIYEIRGALEGMAARLCAERGSPEIVAALEESLTAIRNSYRDQDMAAVLAHTSSFYQTLFTRVDRHVILMGRIESFDNSGRNGLGYARGGYFTPTLASKAVSAASEGNIELAAVVERRGEVLLLGDDVLCLPSVDAHDGACRDRHQG